jgi:hypothetical protein
VNDDLDSMIEQLKLAWAAANRSPGTFKFFLSVKAASGDCVCAIALGVDSGDVRAAVAKALTG